MDRGKITIDRMPLPALKSNQVLVKSHQASVCGSERYFYRGITVRPQDEAKMDPGCYPKMAAPAMPIQWAPWAMKAEGPSWRRVGP